MKWDRKALVELERLFVEKYLEMRNSTRTDRRNFSEKWKRYVARYDGEIIHNFKNGRSEKKHVSHTLSNLISFVNFRDEVLADALVISNPDRLGQLIALPRDMASRIMALGML